MTGQIVINMVFGTAIGFLLAQWFMARHDAKLLMISFDALRKTIDDLAKREGLK